MNLRAAAASEKEEQHGRICIPNNGVSNAHRCRSESALATKVGVSAPTFGFVISFVKLRKQQPFKSLILS